MIIKNSQIKPNETLDLLFDQDGPLKAKRNLDNDVYHVGHYHTITQHDLKLQMDSSRTETTTTVNSSDNLGDNQQNDTGEVVKTVRPSFMTSIMSGVKTSVMGGGQNDVISFLRKPVVIARGAFATTDGPATFPVRGLFAGLDDPIRLDKLKGNYSIRADTVITLEANGNPFQNGLMILASMPTGGAPYSNAAVPTWVNQHRFGRFQISQLNHVILDINTDKRVQLRAPFISGMTSHNIASSNNEFKQGNPGVFFLYPYLPLEVATGSNTVPYTLWLHYENVELFGSAIPQSRSTGTFKKDFSIKESEDGPLASTLAVATKVTSVLASVPMLSSFMGPISYITNAAAGMARHFGLSKPALLDKQIRVVESLAPYIGSSDMHSNAMPLSLIAENHVGVIPGFAGVDIDEMSIDYIKTIPSFFGSFIWPFTSVAGAELYSEWTDPSKYYATTTDGISSLTSFAPVAMLGMMFQQWQGPLRITLRFAKTQFHSGRLAFVYNLKDQAIASTVITQVNLPYAYKHIIDISRASEFTFELPYIANTEWCLTAFNTDAGTLSPGEWSILVVDPLIFASTVPNAIRCVMEVSGGKDMHFSVPNGFGGMPCSILNLQSGMVEKENIDAILGTVVGTENVENYHNSCSNSVGEIIDSLRLLIKRGGPFFNSGVVSSATSFSIAPHVTLNLRNNVAIPPTGSTVLDPYNLISSFYCLGRGGFRTHLIASSGQSAVAYWLTWFLPYNISAPAWTSALGTYVGTFSQALYLSQGSAMAPVRGSEFKGVQTPQYLRGHSRNLIECTVYSGGTTVPGYPSSAMVDAGAIYCRSVGTSVGQTFYRATADDHTFGGFTSIPPMYFPTPP